MGNRWANRSTKAGSLLRDDVPYSPRMAETEGPDPRDEDLIAELADIGERTLRRIVGFPRRLVGEARERLGGRLDDVATKLRSIDPLDRRVAELEKRLDSLEKPEKPTPTRAKSSRGAVSKVSTQLPSNQAGDDPGPLGDDTSV
jgi:hypothetical protein